ncbi:MAG: SDR family oxidoreductase [Desulfurococcales archaeon]|nr:SDR family oxidoreductase [Desulfurococcales archaeon]
MPWAIVTASSRGIGFHISKALAELGLNLVLGSRNMDRLVEAASSLSQEYGVEALPVQLDMRWRESVEGFIKEVDGIVDSLEVLAVNYGNPSCEPCTLREAEWSDWMEAASMYIAATAELFKYVASRWRTRVILVSSFTTRTFHRGLIVADTIRKGLEVLVKAAALEYAGRLYPVLLLLGSFPTPGAWETIKAISREKGVKPETYWKREVEGLSALKRAGRFEELRDLVKFLARAPEYLTGATILFDGGSLKCY